MCIQKYIIKLACYLFYAQRINTHVDYKYRWIRVQDPHKWRSEETYMARVYCIKNNLSRR